MGENNRRMRNNWEMFLSCPPQVESMPMPLIEDNTAMATASKSSCMGAMSVLCNY